MSLFVLSSLLLWGILLGLGLTQRRWLEEDGPTVPVAAASPEADEFVEIVAADAGFLVAELVVDPEEDAQEVAEEMRDIRRAKSIKIGIVTLIIGALAYQVCSASLTPLERAPARRNAGGGR